MCASSPFEHSDVLFIDRGQWLTGTALKASNRQGMLRNKAGLMCCLGFECVRAGIPAQYIINLSVPSEVEDRDRYPSLNFLWKQLDEKDNAAYIKNNKLSQEGARMLDGSPMRFTVEDYLSTTNDNDSLHPIRKEARIAKLFKKYGGVTVKFVGRYQDATAKARKAMKEAA